MEFRFPDKPTDTTPEFLEGLKDNDWLCQDKYDGWRAGIYIDSPGQIRLLSRVGNILTAKTSVPASIVEELKQLQLPNETVFDAEFVGPRGEHEPKMYIFDCLAFDGEWLFAEKFQDRWTICQKSIAGEQVVLAHTVDRDFAGRFNSLKEDWVTTGRGMHLTEGIVVKRKVGIIKLSSRKNEKSSNMFKVKYRDIRGERF